MAGMSADDVYSILSRKIRNLQMSGGGITDYRDLTGKPQINGIELIGELSLEALGIREMTNAEIDEIIENIGGMQNGA